MGGPLCLSAARRADTAEVERLLIGNLCGSWQGSNRARGRQTRAVSHRKDALLAFRNQIRAHDHLAGAVQLQAAVS